MGKLEVRAKLARRKGYVQQAVLATVGAAGIISLALVAPNTLQLIPKFLGNKYKFAYQARSAAFRLAAKGQVRFVESRGSKYIEITAEGQRILALQQEKLALRINERRRWDKQWRLIIFDIPEKRRPVRVRLRNLLQQMGFLRLQDSVWVFPYDCEEVATLLKAELHAGKDVLYIIATQIENDKHLREHFKLS